MMESKKIKLLFATKNEHKVSEVRKIFDASKFEIMSLADFPEIQDIEESGKTFEENAFIKASAVFRKFGIPVIADDSGLAVEQLNGEPGIYSSRYAGDNATDKENNMKLLNELKKFPEPHLAKFVCAAVFYDGKKKFAATGELHGEIILQPRGNYGFGYDPLFIPQGYTKTLAELGSEMKNKISHRAKAFGKMEKILKDNFFDKEL